MMHICNAVYISYLQQQFEDNTLPLLCLLSSLALTMLMVPYVCRC